MKIQEWIARDAVLHQLQPKESSSLDFLKDDSPQQLQRIRLQLKHETEDIFNATTLNNIEVSN